MPNWNISGSEKLFRQRINDNQSSRMESTREKVLHKAKIRSLKISVVIVVAFVVCWTPYYIMMITFIYLKPDPKVMESMMAGIFFFGSSTALINPLIYGAFHLHRRTRGRHHMSCTSENSAHLNRHTKNSRTNLTERLNMSVNGSYKCITTGQSDSTKRQKQVVAYGKSNSNYSHSFL